MNSINSNKHEEIMTKNGSQLGCNKKVDHIKMLNI